MTSIAIIEAVNTSYVPFNGQQIITAMAAGIAYVAMKPIVENLGMSWSTQMRKLLSQSEKYGYAHMNIPTKSGIQKMLCLPLKKLNGWLFSINPEKVRADIRDKLIQYQEECFTVLHDYWTKGEVKNPRKKTTVDERTPLRDAVNMLVSKRHIMYPEAYAMIHQRFNVDSIEDLEPSQIPTAIEYVHRVALEGEFLGKQETLPAPKFDVNIPLQWWIDNNPVVRSGNLSFGKSLTAPAFDVTMEMLCGDNSTSAAIRLINVLEDAGFDVSAPKAEIVAMRKHLGNVEYGMKAIADACRRAGSKTISFRGGKAEYVIG
ncbi:phage antirepressor N-terminal domain-containing protein [Klebsiella pneumoniae]|uniref:phage antirepressor N-terminal domain-containing protein n=1 Tax=Klebsiella pneumoniae TaxID=573 RepID=UPI0006519389|nr:phage antirepressor N-terminal domain-containing protein [Klebsiella pneumoniae]KMG75069.1 antirepressor protein ant [Klebsiella pneumoniae]